MGDDRADGVGVVRTGGLLPRLMLGCGWGGFGFWVTWLGWFFDVDPFGEWFVSGRVVDDPAGAVEVERAVVVYDLAGHETALWYRAGGYRALQRGETFKLAHLPVEP